MRFTKLYESLPSASGPWFEVEDIDPEFDGKILVRIGTAPDGRLVMTGLMVDREDSELMARDLRRIPVAKVLTHLAGVRRSPWLRRELDRAGVTHVRPGPKGYGDEHFERVAEAYREALGNSPRAPVKALVEEFGVSEATVRRWIRRARDRGDLGESRPGKAGEFSSE